MDGWIGVDLDGTLADHYWPEKGSYDPERVGEPIPLMLQRVRTWLERGIDVRIFTARVGPHGTHYHDGSLIDPDIVEKSRRAIERWCEQHLGRALPVTATKDYQMLQLWDDRAVQVIPNTGVRVDSYLPAQQAG